MQNDPSIKEINPNNNAPSETAPSSGASSENTDSKSSMGLKPNIAATLSYALVWIIGHVSYWIVIGQMIPGLTSGAYSGAGQAAMNSIMPQFILSLIISGVLTAGAGFIFFVLEKESRFVRVHAMQAILFGVLWFASSFVFTIATLALGAGIAVLSLPVSIAFLVVWIWLMVKAYKGDMLKLPFIGEQAEKIVAK